MIFDIEFVDATPTKTVEANSREEAMETVPEPDRRWVRSITARN